MPAPTEYPISNRYKITAQDHGRFLKIGNASNSDVSTWEVQFVPDASWDGEFAVMGRLDHTQIEADVGPFMPVPFRKVVLNGAVIHEDVEAATPTGHAWVNRETPTGPFLIQADHGPIAVRNVRIRPLAGPREGAANP